MSDEVNKNETGWLIQASFNDIPHYWNGVGFNADSLQAIRFARQRDAGMTINALGLDGKAVEHMWCPR